LLKIGFLRITPASLKISQEIQIKFYVGQTQISPVKILPPWAKGTQNVGEKRGCYFCNGYNNSHFFVHGTDRHEIQTKKRQSVSSTEY